MNIWDRLNLMLVRAAGATRREEGQTIVEYGLILALISLAVVAAMLLVTGSLRTVFTDISTKLGSAIP
jgi:pilus assembly protein Flp/PilA